MISNITWDWCRHEDKQGQQHPLPSLYVYAGGGIGVCLVPGKAIACLVYMDQSTITDMYSTYFVHTVHDNIGTGRP